MAAPRVLFVNQTGVMSGAEYVLASLAGGWAGASALLFEEGPLDAALQKQGLEVTVAPAGARLGAIRRDQSLLAALPLASRLVRLIMLISSLARRHDVVYANSQKAFMLSALASLFYRRPLIWHLHDIIDARHFGSMQRKLQIALANRRASRVIVPSKAAADAFIEAGGKPSLVHVVPNGIALSSPARQSRAELGLPEGPLVGVFSRLAPWKGQHVVLDALHAVPAVHCVIVGSALFGEDAYQHSLLEQVKRLQLEERVHFLGQRSDVPLLMQAVDAVIHPSVDPEPFGLTLVEAMRAGTPVMASDAGASAEILDGEACGTLFAPRQAAALADALKAFLADPAPFQRKAERAKARVHDVYGLDRMIATISGLIREVAR